MKFVPIVGLEIHVQPKTSGKVFCNCRNVRDAEQNNHVCPVCLGYPGAMPSLNNEVKDKAIMAGLALGCKINRISEFARKHYFYPDMPKGYQITQGDSPVCGSGELEFESGGKFLSIEIERLHIEEDSGKSYHDDSGNVLIDFNRSGSPLLEIVTLPSSKSPDEIYDFLKAFKNLMVNNEISKCRMENGELRCDVNISLSCNSDVIPGYKVEIKNLNSFANVKKALKFEIERQYKILSGRGILKSQTRRWDERKKETLLMRTKEEENDYRFFNEPDLPPLVCDEDYIEKLKEGVLPPSSIRLKKYIFDFGLKYQYAKVIADDKSLCSLFEKIAVIIDYNADNINTAASIIINEVRDIADKYSEGLAEAISKIVTYIRQGIISSKSANIILNELSKNNKDIEEIIEQRKLKIIRDPNIINNTIETLIDSESGLFKRLSDGDRKAFTYFKGLIIQSFNGNVDTELLEEILKKKLLK